MISQKIIHEKLFTDLSLVVLQSQKYRAPSENRIHSGMLI